MAPPPPPLATLDEEEDPYHGIVSTRKRNPVVLVGEWRAEEGAPASCAPRRFSRSIGFGPRRAVAPCAPLRCALSLSPAHSLTHTHTVTKKKLTGAGLTAAVLAAGLIAFRQVCVCGER